ncbi:MAG: hypothetical protein V9G29_01430 [Burkholderiaceae bacterium]
MPLVDLRLTTIEPVDIRGAIYADEVQGKTVWFPPEFLPAPDQPAGILFLDELTAADQRLQISAYSLILDRRVGNYRLPDGWQVIAAGNASFHGAVSHDMGTALADRMFHFNVQTVIDAFLAHALACGFAPEVMAYLKVRPDKLDDTQAQLANDHLVGASPRGWEDISNVLKSGLSESAQAGLRAGPHRRGQRGRVLRRAARDCRPRVDVVQLLASRPGDETAALLPKHARRPLRHGLRAAGRLRRRRRPLARALEIIEQLPDARSAGAAAGARSADAGDGAADAEGAGGRARGRHPRQPGLPAAMPSNAARRWAESG